MSRVRVIIKLNTWREWLEVMDTLYIFKYIQLHFIFAAKP